MDNRRIGIFSLSLKSLKLQIATLMDEVGGDKALVLLDILAKFDSNKRDIILDNLISTLNSLKAESLDLDAQPSLEENELFSSVLNDLKSQKKSSKRENLKFQVLSKGKKHLANSAEVISLKDYLEAKS